MTQVLNQVNNINLNNSVVTENSSNLKNGNYVLIKSQPYKIINIYSTQTNLVQFTGINPFTGDKIIEWFEGTDALELPEINFKEYKFETIDSNKLILKDSNGTKNTNIELPKGENTKEVKKQLETNQGNISVKTVKILGQEAFDSLIIN